MNHWNKHPIREITLKDGTIIEHLTLDMADDPNREKASQLHLNAMTIWVRVKYTTMWLNVRSEKWRKWETILDYINYVTEELQNYVNVCEELRITKSYDTGKS
jgi:hypothetical protein